MQKSILSEKATELAKSVLMLAISRKHSLVTNVLLNQIVRSSTSVSANIEEAIVAISRRDFILKLTIARKELRETVKWVEYLLYCKIITKEWYTTTETLYTQVYKLLNASISTAARTKKTNR